MLEKDYCNGHVTDIQIWWLILDTWYTLYRLRQIELAPFNITVEQSTILVTLGYIGGSATLKQIEDITLRQQNSVSTLISRMELKGLITKNKYPDARKSQIHISGEGRDLLEKITAHSMKEVFSYMTASEKQELAGYLYSLRVKVRDLIGVAYQPPFVQAILGKSPQAGDQIAINNTIKTVSDYNLWVFINGAGFSIYRLRQLEMQEFNLTVEQSIVLMMLQNSNTPVTARVIEDVTLRQPTSISKLLRRMIEKGLVTRRKNHGHRGYGFSLTGEGKALSDKLTNISIEMVLSILTENEKQRLTDCLRDLNLRARGLLGAGESPSSIELVS